MKKLIYLLAVINSSLYSMQSFHPDDINSPSYWVAAPENPAPIILPDNLSKPDLLTINQRHFYRPATINDVKNLIVCAFIHNQALEQNNNYQEHFAAVKRFATWYATIKHKNLELFSCQYTEPWSDNKQVKAGEQLQNILTQYYPNAETVLFGHSNGANISNYVSRIMSAEKPIDLMVHLSCPRKRNDNYQPLHYKNLLYFFSDNDGTEIPNESHLINNTKNYVRMGLLTPCILIDSCVETHSTSQTLFSPVIKVASLLNQEEPTLAEGTHDFLRPDEKITIGFKINDDKLNSLNIIQQIPEIIEQTLTEYPCHYASSSGFTVHTNKTSNNSLFSIALRTNTASPLTLSPSIPTTIDYFVRHNQVNSILNIGDFSCTDQTKEINHSNQIIEQYEEINKSIPPTTNTTQLQTNSSNSYFNTIAAGALITLFIALLYKLFFKKQPSPSENDNENKEESSTETITAADIFNNFVLTTQPL